jgi:site-specific DNA-methyltransferase (adenine-specific)
MNSETVDLIYLDPPFNSKRIYSAPIGSKAAGASFKDIWTWKDVDEFYLDTLADQFPALAKYIASVGTIHSKPMMAYLTYMAQRIVEMHRILKETGSLYLHCDPTASHYLKTLLDAIFGKNNFRNEVAWNYTGWNKKLNQKFESRHDIILFYAKGDNSSHFSSYSIPWKSEEEYIKKRKQKVLTDDHGKKYVMSDGGGGKRVRRYIAEAMKYGSPVDDVWDIDKLNNSSKEATGYPTQKPLALLKRIILASSNEGDVVMDPFCGCATACVAAQQLGRRWLGIDLEKNVVNILVDRLSDDAGLFKDFTSTDQIPKRSDIKIVQPSEPVKQRLYKKQNGKCNACGVNFESRNLEIDHIVPKAKGGGDYYENYQLLCGNCNRIKGDRPMEYLRMKIEKREQMMKAQIIFGE